MSRSQNKEKGKETKDTDTANSVILYMVEKTQDLKK